MEQHEPRPPSVLSIAGSDSGGGAGIQADLKTFAAHDVHGLTAIAALTAQHTRGVTGVHTPPPAFLRTQLDALFEDFAIAAVKIGMLATREVIDVVADALAQHGTPPLVLDPVMVASSGAVLLDPRALSTLRDRLVPQATVLTPNLPEAEILLGHPIETLAAMHDAARTLHALGAAHVLLKGGHRVADAVVDVFFDGDAVREITHPRLDVDGHGTGCTLSSAIAAQLALGHAPYEACALACDYVHGALAAATRPGRGSVSVLAHNWEWRRH